ncbi:MAG TPA: hypothetical protein VGV87_27885 [Blastocatellia bacterium]|jgi:hypothetical protein|nr:hypothetical protein [Blastocatellia bacterium]
MCQQIENVFDSQASAFDDRFSDHHTRIDSDATKKLLVIIASLSVQTTRQARGIIAGFVGFVQLHTRVGSA